MVVMVIAAITVEPVITNRFVAVIIMAIRMTITRITTASRIVIITANAIATVMTVIIAVTAIIMNIAAGIKPR